MTGRSTIKTPSTHRAEGNGGDRVAFGIEPPRRRVQVPQLLVAVLVVAVSALVGVVLFSRAAARDAVIALAVPVDRGQVVTGEDLRVVYVGTDDTIAAMSPEEIPAVVGLVAATDLEAGILVTPGLFVPRTALDVGEGVVGLALSPGEYPSLGLTPGDTVDVVDTEAGGGVLAPEAVVFDVAELGSQGQRFVSLLMPADTAAAVAAANGPGRLRLVLVAGEGP